ncbi:unnamed protein product [Hymenolepis diminuta]|uniref:Integrase catalytic domain-containing protein n=1 Tax=Hymenolepis diminuta TaxID=6216 RepID=A0A564YS33_HYMDI|nr:unnamed protein product [Hymenolepis diminuta]
MLITSLRHTFSTHGLPETILTDNGAQFSSALPQDFCWSYNVIHVYSSPYHPRSNGQEDRFVDTLKWPLQKSCGEWMLMAKLGCVIENISLTSTQHNYRNWKRIFWVSSWMFMAPRSLKIMKLRKSNPATNKTIVRKFIGNPLKDSR